MKRLTLLIFVSCAAAGRLPAFRDASAQARSLWNTDR